MSGQRCSRHADFYRLTREPEQSLFASRGLRRYQFANAPTCSLCWGEENRHPWEMPGI